MAWCSPLHWDETCAGLQVGMYADPHVTSPSLSLWHIIPSESWLANTFSLLISGDEYWYLVDRCFRDLSRTSP